LYAERCGQASAGFAKMLAGARQKGLLAEITDRYQATPLGWRFLNELQESFLE